MALVTVNAVVYVPVNVRVTEIAGIVAAMTPCALEDRVVATVNVARSTLAVSVAVVYRETRVLRVIEGRSSPCARGVAGRALRRREENGIARRGMCRVGGAVVIALMACNARIAGQAVIVVDVAVGADPRRHCVHAS